ncbi:MAG: serine/threonine-protein phosphatase [Zoogloeaceae bacterium]|nr:serine/threonine-protein phosphatase [Zoogloeaceae bacterium]
MKFTIYQESRIGKRRSNQDRIAYCYSRDALLMVVADGMGGHLYGEIAAQIAVQYIAKRFQREAVPTVADIPLFLSRALINAHHAILDYATEKALDDIPRTTIVLCLIQESTAHWAHAGDSRLYLIREGNLKTRTRDHSRVQMMFEQGLISAAAMRTHPDRNRLYSCLGGQDLPRIDFARPMALHHDDLLVLCSDGAWGHLQDHELIALLDRPDLLAAAPLFLDEAELRGAATCDNLSLIALRWHADGEPIQPTTVSTDTLGAQTVTSRLEPFPQPRSAGPATEFSESEIEQAIAEINAAIHKYNP